MFLIPALDIKDNFCVRLKRGRFKNISIFSKNPLLVLNKWINFGAKRLHLIDLDGALNGKPSNLFITKSILNHLNGKIDIQIGGGIRNLDIINYYFDIGANYLILGTKAIMDPDFLFYICDKFPGKIILSLDIKNSKIAINAWLKFHNISLVKFLKIIKNINVESIIFTDISRDGLLSGLNIDMFLKLSKYFNKPIIMSGGLSSYKDIRFLFNLKNKKILGLICGKSIYSSNLDFFKIQKKILNYNNIYRH